MGEAQDGAEAKQLVAELCPDVLLLDLVMPETRPSQVAAWVREHYPETVTLVLTGHDRDDYLSEMHRVGAAGYLTKDEKPDRIVEAIRCAKRGEPLIVGGLMARIFRWRAEVEERWESLTQRERQVLHLLVEGLENAFIAERLGVTVKTIDYHVGNIKQKLRVSTRMQAVTWVHKHITEDMHSNP
ncbi:MAG: response regulator transcription factor [Chloroflexi bacterium]|nr:response regulator transcription factor [Chloroflexota bacterium]